MDKLNLFITLITILSFYAISILGDGDNYYCCCNDTDGVPNNAHFWYLYIPYDVSIECLTTLYGSQNYSPDYTGYAYEGNGCNINKGACAGVTGICAAGRWCDDGNGADNDDDGNGANRPIYGYQDTFALGPCGGTQSITRQFCSLTSCPNSGIICNTQGINVVDDIRPELYIPESFTTECRYYRDYWYFTDAEDFFGRAYASDLCHTPSLSKTVDPNFFDTIGTRPNTCTYTVEVTYTANDGCTTASVATQVITVVDTEPPIFDSPPLIFAECDSIPAPVATFFDYCDNVFETPAYTDSIIQGSCTGDYTILRTWTANDGCSNTGFGTQLIVVTDTTAPTIIPSPTNSFEIVDCPENIPAIQTYTILDNCGPYTFDVTERTVGLTGTDTHYDLVRSFTASDDCQNTVRWEQVIEVNTYSLTFFAVSTFEVTASKGSNYQVPFSILYEGCAPRGFLAVDPGAATFVTDSLSACDLLNGSGDTNIGILYCDLSKFGFTSANTFVTIDITFFVDDNYPQSSIETTGNIVQNVLGDFVLGVSSHVVVRFT